MRYYPSLGLLTAGFYLLAILLKFAFVQTAPYVHPWTWYIPGFFAFITLLQHRFIMRSAQGSPSAFVRTFMGITALKMLLLIGLFLLLILFRIYRPKLFAIWFLFSYFSYSLFEVFRLYKVLRKSN